MFVPNSVLVIILVLALVAGVAVGAAIIYLLKSDRGSTRSSFTRGNSDARHQYGASDASPGFVPVVTSTSWNNGGVHTHGHHSTHEAARAENENAANAEGHHDGVHDGGHDGGGGGGGDSGGGGDGGGGGD